MIAQFVSLPSVVTSHFIFATPPTFFPPTSGQVIEAVGGEAGGEIVGTGTGVTGTGGADDGIAETGGARMSVIAATINLQSMRPPPLNHATAHVLS
jgi:hypothetical protein